LSLMPCSFAAPLRTGTDRMVSFFRLLAAPNHNAKSLSILLQHRSFCSSTSVYVARSVAQQRAADSDI